MHFRHFTKIMHGHTRHGHLTTKIINNDLARIVQAQFGVQGCLMNNPLGQVGDDPGPRIHTDPFGPETIQIVGCDVLGGRIKIDLPLPERVKHDPLKFGGCITNIQHDIINAEATGHIACDNLSVRNPIGRPYFVGEGDHATSNRQVGGRRKQFTLRVKACAQLSRNRDIGIAQLFKQVRDADKISKLHLANFSFKIDLIGFDTVIARDTYLGGYIPGTDLHRGFRADPEGPACQQNISLRCRPDNADFIIAHFKIGIHHPETFEIGRGWNIGAFARKNGKHILQDRIAGTFNSFGVTRGVFRFSRKLIGIHVRCIREFNRN